jgi:iron-sulfur cluster repair protein YtfE (RIC family)
LAYSLQRVGAEDDEREETMSDEPLMPSEVRRKVLSQHREIEQMLSELETGVAQLGDGKVDAEQVKRAAYALRGILELHMNFEETHMVPAITDADGFGPERARHLHSEHAEQRQELDRLVDQIREASSPNDLTISVTKLAEMLRKDIEEEERDYVNEKLLHDHIMPSDTFGG